MYDRSFEWIDDEKIAKRRLEVDTGDDVEENTTDGRLIGREDSIDTDDL